MKYYTADLHLFHTNMIKYENRPFRNATEMNEAIIKAWNEKVKPQDEVYILGDFGFCTGEEANACLTRMNGRKYLIKGNHDKFLNDTNFNRSLFGWIRDYFVVYDGNDKVVLCHYPIAVWDCEHHGALHFYGHVHSNTDNRHPALAYLKNAYNVGVDMIGYAPLSLQEIRNR